MLRNSFFRYSSFAGCALSLIIGPPASIRLWARSQATPKDISFELATVKPVQVDTSHPFDPRHSGVHVNLSGASYWTMTVGYLVAYAYGVSFVQVLGPKWTVDDRFDIETRFPEGAAKQDDRKMLQSLLRDRFRLAFHIEKREQEVYVLGVGKHGSKLTPSLPNEMDSTSGVGRESRPLQVVTFDQERLVQHWEIRKTTMEELAARLSICVGSGFHKVVDETGIKGDYQVTLDCPVPRPPQPVSTSDGDVMPSDSHGSYLLSKSLDMSGLKVEKRKVLTDVYVIDHVERPSEN